MKARHVVLDRVWIFRSLDLEMGEGDGDKIRIEMGMGIRTRIKIASDEETLFISNAPEPNRQYFHRTVGNSRLNWWWILETGPWLLLVSLRKRKQKRKRKRIAGAAAGGAGATRAQQARAGGVGVIEMSENSDKKRGARRNGKVGECRCRC